jgi:hypothetical protein
MQAMPPKTLIALAINDIPMSYLGQFAKLLFDRIQQEVLGRPKLSAKERNFFEGEVKTFVHNFEKILASNDEQQRETALRAMMSVLAISYCHAGGSQILREIKEHCQEERTKQLHWGLSRPDIQAIIERLARELWKRKPQFKGNCEGTAKKIYELRKLARYQSSQRIGKSKTLKTQRKKSVSRTRSAPPFLLSG